MRARRTDQNLRAIVDGLRARGVSVLVLNSEVDLAVGYDGRTTLVEVKNPEDRRPSHRNRSEVQAKLRASWLGAYAVVETLPEALAVIGWIGGDGGNERVAAQRGGDVRIQKAEGERP